MSHRMDSLTAERKEQVRVEGEQIGQAKAALAIARKKFGVEPKQLEALLQAAKPEEMVDWMIRLANASSIEEAMVGKGRLGIGAPVWATPEPSGHSGSGAERWKGCVWNHARDEKTCASGQAERLTGH